MLQDGQEILEGRFQIIKKVGSGAFGEIYKGKYTPTRSLSAFTAKRPAILSHSDQTTRKNLKRVS